MLVIGGTISFDPANTEAAKAAAAAMMAATQQEAGCVHYAFSIDVADPSVMHVFEQWESEDALSAHFEAPHMVDFQAAIGGLGISGTDILKYQVSSSGPVR